MKKYLKQLFIIIVLIIILILPYLVFAKSKALDKLEDVGFMEGPYQQATETTVSEVLGYVVNALLGLLGVIFIALMVFAGYNWMTARGNEEKTTKAKDTITQAIIGLVLVIAAYAIWAFIKNMLTK